MKTLAPLLLLPALAFGPARAAPDDAPDDDAVTTVPTNADASEAAPPPSAAVDPTAPDAPSSIDDDAVDDTPTAVVDDPAAAGDDAGAAPAAVEPADDAPAAATDATTTSADCLRALGEDRVDDAERCLRAQAAAERDPERGLIKDELVRGLVDVRAPRPSAAPKLSLQSFLLSGRPELALLATAHGATMTTLFAVGGLSARYGFFSNVYSPSLALLESSIVLASPLVGGAVGLASGAAVALRPDVFSDDDVNLMRASTFVGAFDAALAVAFLSSYPSLYLGWVDGRLVPLVLTTTAAAALASPLVGALGASLVVDVPAGGSALALSCGAIAALVTLFTLAATDQRYSTDLIIALVATTSHLAAAAAIGTSFLFPIHRIETWVVDLGALAGLLAAAALVFGLPAGNPITGWGGLAAGVTLGAVGGFAVAQVVPPVFNVLPSVDDVLAVPMLIPSLDGREVGMGFGVTAPLELRLP